MTDREDERPCGPATAGSTRRGVGPGEAQDAPAATSAEDRGGSVRMAAPGGGPSAVTSPPPTRSGRPAHPWRRRLVLAAAVVGLAVGGYVFLLPRVETMLNTVSTDDAYVNGHVTLVAPRVAGQVAEVLVDDNYRVRAGDVLVRLDREPYQVQLDIKAAAVAAAEADLAAARAEVRSLVAQARANRFQLQHAIEDVNARVADLRANVASLESRTATLELARHNLERGEELARTGGISKEELDRRRQEVRVDEAAVNQALQAVYACRVGLGLPEEPPEGHDLAEVPADLGQQFSAVRQGLGQLLQSAAQFGYAPTSWDVTPDQAIAEFYKQDPGGDLDKILARLIPDAPPIKQAEARLLRARRELAQAELDLRYCDVVSEIDGLVTRRNVNPGNNVQAGQGLMAVRSLTEIWVDANFKETQLADLRIGQRVRCEVDMYGKRREFEGRITGFTMGTGQSLALLPPQNATGNFVKIVQRLPVRIELTGYDPAEAPLFVGLSVVPYVYYKEPPTGPHAGEFLQPPHALPQAPTAPVVAGPSQSVAPPPGGVGPP
ncbi:HlyD family secretion protein [Tautonia plasticadhaerens]|uniref:Multidrug export protein EmrA n=1 Tax=Tautonia plasticadhaerens TaxID=2527974 RepID=A0A518HF54_9BACT|nr:HlyD family secretion protein [Tautonia plasticadhaerens]QDV39406.1 Multidrug export protein EmrA [Tautonia plasticadhaerens]